MVGFQCKEDKKKILRLFLIWWDIASATVVSIVCSRPGLAGKRPPKQITHGLLDKVIVLVIDEYPLPQESKLYRYNRPFKEI